MSNSYSDHNSRDRREDSREGGRGNFRGGRNPGNRESGGFRIRLSENEMKAARSIQEAFHLRSTVAVLGFALRTLGQMLHEGKLDELVAEHQSQSNRPESFRESRSNGARKDQFERGRGSTSSGVKPNPFARPEKPQPQKEELATELLEENTSKKPEEQTTDSCEIINSSSSLEEASSPTVNGNISSTNDNDQEVKIEG